LDPRKISLLAESIRTRIGPLSHAISYNGRHVSDRIVIAELENLIRISMTMFPEHADYFTKIQQDITAGNVPLVKVVETLNFIDDLALRRASVNNHAVA
jgi:predicted DNA-binding ArsR family transcriptional regulator